MDTNDASLVRRIRQGDEWAFGELVRRYEYPLAALIRYTVVNPVDAEDVLQETLVDAWAGLRRLREPGNVRAWLMQVARNRCSDYFRSRERREISTESSELEDRIDALGHAYGRDREVIGEMMDALECIPDAERRTARLFYLDGLTIAEIAERHRCPAGTVKRQLFTARDSIRQTLGIAPPERAEDMGTHRVGSRTQQFPKTRPQVEIAPLEIEPFVVECREMRYWSIIPEIGQRALHADYDWEGVLRRVWDLRATRRASVHNVEGVEIELSEWWWEDGWRPIAIYYYGRVLEDRVQWLAGMDKGGQETKLRTFLDEGFVWAYPDNRRFIGDGDLFVTHPDGPLTTTREHDDFTESGAGYFTVRIGDRPLNCLRVVGLEGPVASEDAGVTEAYLTDTGRMALMKHYCKPSAALRCGETVSETCAITVDGHTFSHFRDTLTDTGCGIDIRVEGK